MLKKIWYYCTIFLSGAFMSISDIIPGFSGGVALTISGKIKDVWGTWEKIKRPERKGDRIKGILFYVVFALGSLGGTFGFAQVLKIMLKHIPTYTFWFFVALSLTSLVLFWKFNGMKVDKKENKVKPKHMIGFISGLSIIIILCLMTFILRGYQSIDSLHNSDGRVDTVKIYIMIYVAGFFASAAMVTPGMSGALIILVFGVYGNIYGGMYAHPMEHWLVLSLYFLFTLLGTITSIFTLDKLYKRFTKVMNYMFLGAITGSLIGMTWIFHEILIPTGGLAGLYITISILLAFSFAGLIMFGFMRQQRKTKA